MQPADVAMTVALFTCLQEHYQPGITTPSFPIVRLSIPLARSVALADVDGFKLTSRLGEAIDGDESAEDYRYVSDRNLEDYEDERPSFKHTGKSKVHSFDLFPHHLHHLHFSTDGSPLITRTNRHALRYAVVFKVILVTTCRLTFNHPAPPN